MSEKGPIRELGAVGVAIEGKPAAERAQIKVEVFARLPVPIRYEREIEGQRAEIEILSLADRGNGLLTVECRATLDGEEIKLGTPFHYQNPPIRVPDGTTTTVTDAKGITREAPNFGEDLPAALTEIVGQTVDMFAAGLLVAGEGGDDTLVVYPNAHVESTSVDGYVGRGASSSWADLRGGAGTIANDSDQWAYWAQIVGARDGDLNWTWNGLIRGIALFDSSALGAGATISAVVASLYITTVWADGVWGSGYNWYTSTPASNIALQASDYAQLGVTAQADAANSYAGVTLNAYNHTTFNAVGRGHVVVGISKFGIRDATYDAANVEPEQQAGEGEYAIGIYGRAADYAGTTSDPKLTITYTPGAPSAVHAGWTG